MTEFEKKVAHAAVAADPAPLSNLKVSVLAKLPNEDSGKVDQTINDLVARGVIVCTNTVPPPETPGYDRKTFMANVAAGSPPPTYFKYEKWQNWED